MKAKTICVEYNKIEHNIPR